jgi:predicted dinucleotide-binding enzyme
MKIGMLGSGNVGHALGTGFIAHGHQVKVGSREPTSDRVKGWVAKAGKLASAGTFADAASFAEVAVLATQWSGTENAIRLANPKNLVGKVVIDVTNGHDASHGCIRMMIPDVIDLYSKSPVGTPVYIL